jgi:hypothetical protein
MSPEWARHHKSILAAAHVRASCPLLAAWFASHYFGMLTTGYRGAALSRSAMPNDGPRAVKGECAGLCILIRGLLRSVTHRAVPVSNGINRLRSKLGYSTDNEALRTVNVLLRNIIRFHGISGKFGIASGVCSD